MKPSTLSLALIILQCIFHGACSSKPLQQIQVTLKGQVLYLSDVTTVKELQSRLFEETGLDEREQGSASYQGKILEKEDCLADCGVDDGAQVNMIPTVMANHMKTVKDMKQGLAKLRTKLAFSTNMKTMDRDRQELQVLEDLLAGIASKVPMVQEQLEEFVRSLQTPLGVARAKDPESIEGLRQVIINNPLVLQYVLRTTPYLPGRTMEETLQDPFAWMQQVSAAIDRWSNMTAFELWENLTSGRLFEAYDL